MLITVFRRLRPPRSLRRQFIVALSALASLIAISSLTAIYVLRVSAETTRQLAEERLVRMQDGQDLVRHTLLIERETNRMLAAESLANMRTAYAGVTDRMAELDQLVERLVADANDPAVLSLRQSSQLFLNTAHVVAGLQESALQADEENVSTPEVQRQTLRYFDGELQRQAEALLTSAQDLSIHFTESYRESVLALAETSRDNQYLVLALLVVSLTLSWLVSRYFIGRHVLSRLQQVSHHLREGDTTGERPSVPVAGSDEISEMARAVEQFMQDRRQLAKANQALQDEKARQQELIHTLADARNQLLQSEKMASIGQLAAGIAHEINNPVGFVNSNLETMKGYVADLFQMLSAYEAADPELSEPTRAAITELREKIDLAYLREDAVNLVAESIDGLHRVKHIVQDLKDFSHVGESEMLWANLESGLDSTLNVAWNELKYKAEVVKEYGGIPDVECIPSQLNQVFLNLLVNAAQAIEAHGTITLRTGQDGDKVWIEVADTGTGIKPEHLPRIFDPFFTTKPVGTGTGLGLSLAYGIVQKHGGEITVTSDIGIGTTFRITLPIHAVGHSESHSPEPD